MKNKKSQEERIIDKLLKDGFVTRNEALRNYISRLGAIIYNLQQDGWVFDSKFINNNGGQDYIYNVVKAPFTKFKYTLPDGKEIIKYEKVKS